MDTGRNVHVHIRREVRRWCEVSSLITLHVILLRQCSKLNLESTRLARLADRQSRDLHVSIRPYAISLEVQRQAISLGLYVTAGDLGICLYTQDISSYHFDHLSIEG